MKLLIGGSPCTHWSIAQAKTRETEPEGLGWELFKNYLIAREKYAPEYFLYENNNSISAAIKKRLTAELGVEPIMIDSALVSAQFRQRLYWTNIPGVEQPEDRGIMLRDLLEKDRKDWRPVGKWTERLFFGSRTRTKLEALKTIESEKAFTLTTKKLHPNNYICNPERTEYSNFTISEYEALQTVPKGYTAYVPEAQRYKMLGNGWTVDVIAHILHYAPGITEEPLEVLSMYDGMSCGHLALNKLGAHITHYYAIENDKYAVKTTQRNFPDTIQLGDAFQVRDDGWSLPGPDVEWREPWRQFEKQESLFYDEVK